MPCVLIRAAGTAGDSGTDWWVVGPTIAAVVVASIAAMFAALAARAATRSARASEALVAVEVERREEEHAWQLIADVRACYRSQSRPDTDLRGRPHPQWRFWLQIENRGPATAKDVTVVFDPAPPHSLKPENMPTELVEGRRIDLPFTNIPGATRPRTLITWTDGRGSHTLDVPTTFVSSND